MHTCTHTHTHTHTRARACTHTCMLTLMHTHTRARAHAHARARTRAQIHAHASTHAQIHAHASTHAQIHAHARAHARARVPPQDGAPLQRVPTPGSTAAPGPAPQPQPQPALLTERLRARATTPGGGGCGEASFLKPTFSSVRRSSVGGVRPRRSLPETAAEPARTAAKVVVVHVRRPTGQPGPSRHGCASAPSRLVRVVVGGWGEPTRHCQVERFSRPNAHGALCFRAAL